VLQLPPLPGVPAAAGRSDRGGAASCGPVTCPRASGSCSRCARSPHRSIDPSGAAVRRDRRGPRRPGRPDAGSGDVRPAPRCPPEAVDALLAVAGPGSGSPQTIVELRQLGGAVAREPQVPSALCHRDAAYVLNVIGVPVGPHAEALVPHGEAVRAALAPWATGGLLPNFAAGAGAERLARSYDPVTLARLVELAEHYDPSAVLRAGQVPVRTR
jgi:hypothetical protein